MLRLSTPPKWDKTPKVLYFQGAAGKVGAEVTGWLQGEISVVDGTAASSSLF